MTLSLLLFQLRGCSTELGTLSIQRLYYLPQWFPSFFARIFHDSVRKIRMFSANLSLHFCSARSFLTDAVAPLSALAQRNKNPSITLNAVWALMVGLTFYHFCSKCCCNAIKWLILLGSHWRTKLFLKWSILNVVRNQCGMDMTQFRHSNFASLATRWWIWTGWSLC